jgi:two-component system OmpR family response regulator
MRHTRSILVVDDERPICDLLADLLDEEGYAVRRAYDGLTALEFADRYRPDLVLTDVMMPGLDGVGLIHRLRERGVRSPVLLMSAVYADVDLPHVRFVPKPFDVDDILTVIQRTLRKTARPTTRRGLARLWHTPHRTRRRHPRPRMQTA